MSKILCLGSAGKDIFLPTDQGKILETPDDLTSQRKIAFELGAKIKIKRKHEALGGCAANTASGLSKLGLRAACVSSIGDDWIGVWVKKQLETNGVDTSLLTNRQGSQSDFSAILVDESTGERVIFTNRNSSGELEINARNTAEAEWFFVSDLHGKWEDQLEAVFELAKAGNKKVAFNPREAGIHEDAAEIIEAIGLSEILFVNKDEAIEIVSNMHSDADPENVNDEKYLLEKLKSLEVKLVVLTDGLRGAWVADGENIFHCEAGKSQAVDTTGAGDSFAAAFLAARVKGKEIEECLRWGIVNSASVVQHYGAIEGLLLEEEVLKKTKNVKIEKL